MNRIILDHLKRWGWLGLAVTITNGFIAVAAAAGGAHFPGYAVMFPLVMWAGAMQLNFDLQRGISRAITTLPVTASQIGRAWWISSVALPAALLTVTTSIGLMIYSAISHREFPLLAFVSIASANALFLGAIFTLFVGETQAMPQNATGWLRRVFSIGCMMALMFVPPSVKSPEGIFTLLVGVILSVAGWFRAEQMVVQRATFRPGIQTGKNTPGQHRAPSGFGGLGYLIWKTYARSTLAGLAIMIFMILITQFISHNRSHSHVEEGQFLSQTISSGTTPYVFFILIFSLVPLSFQLRQLRTMPIAAATLAAVMILIPVLSVLTVGLGIAGIGSVLTGGAVLTPVMNSFLMLGAKTAIISVIVIWRGLKTLTGLLVFLLILTDSFAQLGATLTYHSGTITEKISCGASSVTCLAFTLIGIALTLGLFKTSSQVYRPPAANMATWGNWGGGR